MSWLFNRWSLIAAQSGLLVIGLVIWIRMSEAKATLVDSKANVQRSQQLATEIKQMRQLQSIAEDESVTGLTNSYVLQIAERNGMNETQVKSVQRLPPTQIEGTDYERQDVSLQLSEVSMQQVIRFLLGIEGEFSSVKATSMQLRANRRNVSNRLPGERWNAQLTLTQLVYLGRSGSR